MKHGLKALGLRKWRLNIEEYGGEQPMPTPEDILRGMAPSDIKEPMQICQFGDHPAALRHSKHYIICSEHWDLIIRGLEALYREEERNGSEAGNRNGATSSD